MKSTSGFGFGSGHDRVPHRPGLRNGDGLLRLGRPGKRLRYGRRPKDGTPWLAWATAEGQLQPEFALGPVTPRTAPTTRRSDWVTPFEGRSPGLARSTSKVGQHVRRGMVQLMRNRFSTTGVSAIRRRHACGLIYAGDGRPGPTPRWCPTTPRSRRFLKENKPWNSVDGPDVWHPATGWGAKPVDVQHRPSCAMPRLVGPAVFGGRGESTRAR